MSLSSEDLHALIHLQVEGAIAAAQQHRAEQVTDFAPGSQVEHEMLHNDEVRLDSSEWGSVPVEAAYSVGATTILAASYNLASLSQLLSPNHELSLFGFQVVTRSIVEASARAWWLLDPKLSARQRVARSLTERLHSVRQSELAERAARRDIPAAVSVSEDNVSAQLVELCAEAARLGLREDRNDHDKLLGFEDARRTNATTLVRRFLDDIGFHSGEVVYRFYSAIVHATSYAILQYFAAVDTNTQGQLRSVQPRLEFAAVGNAAVLGLSSYLAVLERHGRLYGGSVTALESTRQMRSGTILSEIAAIQPA